MLVEFFSDDTCTIRKVEKYIKQMKRGDTIVLKTRDTDQSHRPASCVKSTLSEKSFSLSFRAVNSKLSIIVPPLFLLSIYEIISEFHSWEVFRHGHHSHTFFRMHFVGFMECRPNLTSRLSLSTALCLSVKPVNSVLSFAFLDLRPSRQWFVEK